MTNEAVEAPPEPAPDEPLVLAEGRVARDVLGGGELRAAMVAYRDALRAHKEVLNRLNVYPVPDGDTGTNMALTLESVVAELEGAGAGMAAVCKAVGHGSLMGARGNSGVILSQVLRGVTDAVKGREEAGAADVAAALAAAADAAYGAVMRPVEGTILTVARAAGEAAQEAAGAGAPLVGVLEAARAAAADALERTPELLPALKQAGVVDAGGAGLVLFVDALLHAVAGRPLPEPPADLAAPAPPPAAAFAEPEGPSDLRYEVMYLLAAPDECIPAFREAWATIGDSIVVVGGDGLWNCHVHTDDIGAAVEAALDVGRPSRIRVTDLAEQVEEERWVREGAPGEPGPPAAAEPVPTAVVAVALGAGFGRLFRSVGVQSVVAGGQTMNPSVAQLLSAVEASPGAEVVVLPNNKNVVPVAEQAAAAAAKVVRVVPTRSVPEGLAAAFAYDPQGDAAANASAMAASAAGVVAGEVTRAVRASSSDAGPIAEGDWLGLGPAGVEVVRPELAAAAVGLLERLVGPGHEVVTVLEGEGSAPAVTRRITEWLAEARPHVEAEVHRGGQPLYPYLFGIE